MAIAFYAVIYENKLLLCFDAGESESQQDDSTQKKRHVWSVTEKSALKNRFGKYIHLGKVQGKAACLEAQRKFPLLHVTHGSLLNMQRQI